MTQVSQDGKTRAIIAHITLIGWIIALVMNNDKKDEFASYYIRQVLGLMIIGIGLSIVNTLLIMIIPFLFFLSIIVPLAILGLFIYSLIGAINEQKTEIPVVGAMFQDWFKAL